MIRLRNIEYVDQVEFFRDISKGFHGLRTASAPRICASADNCTKGECRTALSASEILQDTAGQPIVIVK